MKKEIKKKNETKDDKVHVAGLKGGQRVKLMGDDINPTNESTEAETEALKVKKTARIRGKHYVSNKSKVDSNKHYALKDAIALVKQVSYSKFDGTVELHLVVKKEGMSVNVNLPHSAGRTKIVEVANEKTIEKLKAGKVDFDVLLATADMMPQLVGFARILGPRGMMPNPKNGTLIKSVKDAEAFSQNAITIKTEKKAPLIHTTCGKVSMSETDLMDNASAILNAFGKRQVIKAYMTASMSPSIRLIVN